MAEPGFEPGAAGREAKMLPLCYAAPHEIRLMSDLFQIRLAHHRPMPGDPGPGDNVLNFSSSPEALIDPGKKVTRLLQGSFRG